MKPPLRLLACFCAGLVGCNSAAAQSILSYVVTTPGVDAPSGSFTNWTKTLQLPGFDASLGELTSVKLTFDGVILQTANGENIGATAAPFAYNVTTNLTMSRQGGIGLFAPAATILAGAGTNSVFDGTLDFAGSSAFAFTQSMSVSDSFTTTTPSDLATFIVPGLIDFVGTAIATSSVTGSGQFVSQTISKASARLTVDYTFTPIPEAPHFAALLAGLGFCAAAFRRRQRQAGATIQA